MVKMNRVLIALTLALLASSALLPVSDCASKPSSTPRKEDVPFIKCQVCEKLASRLHQLVKEKQERISPKKVRLCYESHSSFLFELFSLVTENFRVGNKLVDLGV